MRIDIISAVPELLDGPVNQSILKRASDKGLAEIIVHNLRDYGQGPYRQIDDKIYGGSAGMVLMVEPVSNCIDDLKKERNYDDIITIGPVCWGSNLIAIG